MLEGIAVSRRLEEGRNEDDIVTVLTHVHCFLLLFCLLILVALVLCRACAITRTFWLEECCLLRVQKRTDDLTGRERGGALVFIMIFACFWKYIPFFSWF